MPQSNPYKELTIYIPSLGRADNIVPLKFMSKEAKRKTKLVVSPEEFKRYKKKNKDVEVSALDVQGIHKVREFLIRNCPTRYICMLDDDIGFLYRPVSGDWHLKGLRGPKHFDKMFKYLMRRIKRRGYAHVSISMREGSNRCLKDWHFNQRYTRFFIFDLNVLKKVKLGRLTVMEDFDIALQLIRKGYKSAICYLYAQGQGSSNAPGGCSTYRSKQVQKESAEKLKRLHSEFVSVVKKKTKTAWGGGERTDVMIFWKRAYESSRT